MPIFYINKYLLNASFEKSFFKFLKFDRLNMQKVSKILNSHKVKQRKYDSYFTKVFNLLRYNYKILNHELNYII